MHKALHWASRLSAYSQSSCSICPGAFYLLFIAFLSSTSANAQACPSNHLCAYVSTGSDISVVDLTTQSVLPNTIALNSTGSLAVSPDNSYLWSSTTIVNSTTISTASLSSGSLGQPISGQATLLSDPFSLPVSPNSRYAYVDAFAVRNGVNAGLEIIDSTTMTASFVPPSLQNEGTITPFQGIYGASIANGIVYLADSCLASTNQTIPCMTAVSTTSNQIAFVQPLGGSDVPTVPTGSTLSAAGIFVPSEGVSTYVGLDLINTSTGTTTSYLSIVGSQSIPIDSSPIVDIVGTFDGVHVYVSTTAGIYSLNTSSNTLTALSVPGNVGYRDLALSPDNSILYVATSAGVTEVSTKTNAVVGSIPLPNARSIAIMHSIPVPTLDVPPLPTAAPAGSNGLTLTINGSQFVPGSVVKWNNTRLTTTYVSPTQLTVIVPASDLAVEGTASLTVVNPGPGGGSSNPFYFSVTTPSGLATGSAEGALTFSSSTIKNGTQPLIVISGDFNNDGKPDIALVSECGTSPSCTAGSASIMTGLGNGTFNAGTGVSADGMPVAAVAGDFNNDGNLDVVTLNASATQYSVSYMQGNGTGGLAAATTTPITLTQGETYSASHLIAAGDFNHDGNLDIIVFNYNTAITGSPYFLFPGTSYFVLLGQGDGTFIPQPETFNLFSYFDASSVVVGDFDGDGLIDVAVLGQYQDSVGGSSVLFLDGNGDGTFYFLGNSQAIQLTSVPGTFALGDFNNDGIPDLAIADVTGSVSTYNGSGTGTFQAGGLNGLSVNGTVNAATSAHLIGDSSSQLLAAVDGSPGIGQIVDINSTSIVTGVNLGVHPTSVAVADFNGDGRLDVAVANSDGSVSILLQSGLLLVDASPQGLFFGDEYLNATAPEEAIGVRNNGSAPITFGPVSITGTNASEFQLDTTLSGTGNTCPNSPSISLEPFAICYLNVRFTPTVAGPASASISLGVPFEFNANPPQPGTSIPLIGTGDVVTITGQPQSQSIASGQTATMTVTATGISTLTYQWYQGSSGNTSNPIAGATNPTYTTPALNSTTNYWVLVKAGTANSEMAVSMTATITVVTPPTISVQPVSQSVAPGQTATLSVTATGAGTLTYQWYQGLSGDKSNPIAGATNSTFTTPAAKTTASYWVLVSESGPPAEQTNSLTAVITVVPAPVITAEPLSQSVAPGQSATLSVTATGTGTLTYQWYLGLSGDSTNPINGATNSTFTTPALAATTSYWVKVSASGPPAEQTSSATATITIVQPPTISVQPLSQSIAPGEMATLSVTATGTGSLTYQWYIGLSGDTTNPISGATNSAFTTPALSTSTNYWVKVSGSGPPAEQTNSKTAVVTVVPLPTISAQPSGQTVVPGQTATLSVAATSSANLTYQWYVGLSGDTSNPIPGATSNSYTTPPITADTSYWVSISVAGIPADQIMSASAVVIAGAEFPGQSETVTLELPYNPNWPPNSPVNMSCDQVQLPDSSRVPIGNYYISCDVSPRLLKNSTTPQFFTVTIGTSNGTATASKAAGSGHLPNSTGFLPVTSLALLGLLIPGSFRKRFARLLVVVFVSLFTLGVASCGGHFTAPPNSGTTGSAVTPAGTYSIVVTATDGEPGFQQTSLIVPLTVSPLSH